jgi:CRISPR-associated protein Cmr6
VPLYAEAQEEILGLSRCPQGANTGLWYNKMCNKWKDTQAKPWTLNYADKEKRNKENQDSGKTLWIKTVTNGICGDANAIKITLERYVKLVRAAGGDVRVFKTTSRFVTGTGNEHPVENGFTWHHTLGTPFIPGSSVKGMMRCWAEQWWENTDRNGIVSELFGPRSSNQEKSAGNLIVFDALPIKPVWLEIEVMTPHYGTYYQSKENADQSNSGRQDNPPADWHSPIPIPFLTVASNQSFIFGLAPRGELLNDINNRTGISKAIGRFSARVDTIVRKYKGVTVYAGGDDVAALLPMDQALGAAEALQRQYQESFEQLDLHKKPSISAAIVYAHHHTPLNQIIAKAHQVLDKKAKEETGRDAVAVAVYKTGGEVIIWSSPWQVIDSNGNSTSICEIINGLTSDLRQRQLTNSWIYGIRKLLGNSFENRFTSPEGRKDNEENDGMLGRGNRFTIPEGLDLTHLLTAQLMDSRDIDTDVIKAQKIVRHLLTLCAHQYRDGEGRIKREDNTFSLDGALLIKFLVSKGAI